MNRRNGPPTLRTRASLGGESPPSQGGWSRSRRLPSPLLSARADLDLRASRRSDGGWLFEWDSYYLGASFEVWLEGQLLATVVGTSYDYSTARVAVDFADSPPDLEVVPSSAVAENSLYPPFQVVQWRGLQGAAGYVVEKWDGASWVPVYNAPEVGRGSYSYQTPAQPDGSTVRYRVTAFDRLGNGGVPKECPVGVVCRNPERPDVVFSVVGGAIVVAAA